jgi:hypothetical protein
LSNGNFFCLKKGMRGVERRKGEGGRGNDDYSRLRLSNPLLSNIALPTTYDLQRMLSLSSTRTPPPPPYRGRAWGNKIDFHHYYPIYFRLLQSGT